MGSYKYLMVFMSATELGYSLIDVLLKPEVISIGDFWIVGTNSRRTELPLWLAYPLVLLWGASYGVAVASFGVHFIFRYFMVIGNRKWVSGPLNLLFWFTILFASGFIYAFTIHYFLHFDEILEVVTRQQIPDLYGISTNEMVYYGFSLYQIRPSEEWNWRNLEGVIVMGSIVTLSLITMLYFAVQAYWAIQKWSSISVNLCSLSKTLQTQLFYSLVVQTIIPVILIHLPTTIIVLNSFFGTGREIFGKIITVTISLFPAIDPLPSLIIIRPYREAIRGFLPFQRPNPSSVRPEESKFSNFNTRTVA
ncbi:unnamed protein product [Caenorhabditis brenneri]